VSLISPLELNLRSQAFHEQGDLTVPQFSFLALLLTLGGCAADQFAAPMLYSTSPLWATAACSALVWRRGDVELGEKQRLGRFGFSFPRLAAFCVAHILIICAARLLLGRVQSGGWSVSFPGWIAAGLKLSVLLPTLLLLPIKGWALLARVYRAELIAGLLVLFTFFPGRILTTIWPWYGQVLGRLVFFCSGLFVHGLTYASGLTPTISGASLDVTILVACSGISGIELFDYLFAFVVLADWNRMRKGRLLAAYFVGVVAMFLGNALRIVSFVVFGNRGFANQVARFHLSAGWIFFSLIFLAYLSLIYRQLLIRPQAETL
jgi:exosortase/archaeosortase family protein